MEAEERILHRDWDLYDTRHVVFRTRRMTSEALESGYWRAYRDFYRWGSIFDGAGPRRRPGAGSATWRMPAVGRSSSRSGTS
jgi:hypothetical protein